MTVPSAVNTVPAAAVLGAGLTGLAIGYRVLNLDGSLYSAWTAEDVVETSVAGTYRVVGGVVVPSAGGYIVFGTTTTDYAEATAQGLTDLLAIKAKTDLITSDTLTVISPVSSGGDVTIDRGYDYYAADGRAISWTDENPATWPDLTGAAALFIADGLAVAGTITNPTGPATIAVELSAADTGLLAAGDHPFKVACTLSNGHVILQIRGTVKARD